MLAQGLVVAVALEAIRDQVVWEARLYLGLPLEPDQVVAGQAVKTEVAGRDLMEVVV
jgi:hypothetical protein